MRGKGRGGHIATHTGAMQDPYLGKDSLRSRKLTSPK